MKTFSDRWILSNTKATKIVAVTYGIIMGLAAVVHGFYEFLQGDVVIKDYFIDAIGPKQRLWEFSNLHAVSIAPTFLITGILAMSMGIIVIVWSVLFLGKKLGATSFFVLVILTFVLGGGYGPPISLGLLATLASMRINKPITYFNDHLSSHIKGIVIKLWPESLITFIMIFVVSVGITIIGWPVVNLLGAVATNNFVWVLALIMIILMIFSVINALMFDAVNSKEFRESIY